VRTADIIQCRYTRVTVRIVANKCVNPSPIGVHNNNNIVQFMKCAVYIIL